MKFELPKDLKISGKSIGSIISVSTIIGIVTSTLSFFKFDELDISYRVIILLSILLLVSIIDIIILYIKDREKQYKYSYLEFFIQNIGTNINDIKTEIDEVRKDNSEINESIKYFKTKFNSKT